MICGGVRVTRILVAILTISLCAESGASPPGTPLPDGRASTADSLVRAVVALARGGFDDPVRIEERLRLPGMTAVLEWTSPSFGYSQAVFQANEQSALRTLVLVRPVSAGQNRMASLEVNFKRGQCPSLATVETSFGMAFQVTPVPPHHGVTPLPPVRMLRLRAADGRNVYVMLNRDACTITLSALARP